MFSTNFRRAFARFSSRARWAALLGAPLLFAQASVGYGQELPDASIEYRLESRHERLEMTAGESKILSLGSKIPSCQVNNPDILDLNVLGPDEVQIFAKAPGVTTVVLWNEEKRVHTVDVVVYADARELTMILKSQFPRSDIKVMPLNQSVMLSGYVDDLNNVGRIEEMARQYHPNVINNLTVAGAQQVLLKVKVMEVSRTKLRGMGADLARLGSAGDYTVSTISGLLAGVEPPGLATGVTRNLTGPTFQFGVVSGAQQFFAVLEMLQQRNVIKIMAEPDLVAISGREAWFNDGGELPILVQSGLGTTTTQWKPFGTQVDFVPIVQGNGSIRLEVRPRVSEPDYSRVNSQGTPAIVVREVDTGVELKPGQTLAIAGLVQTKTSDENRGLPWISDLPYIGAPFRKIRTRTEDVELLVLVTPYLVDPLDPHQVPPCGPGMASTQPSDVDLYMRGHLEVPACGMCGQECCECGHGEGESEGHGYEGEMQMESEQPTEPVQHQSRRVQPRRSSQSAQREMEGAAIATDATPARPAQRSTIKPVSNRLPVADEGTAPKAKRPRSKTERLPPVQDAKAAAKRRKAERLPPAEKPSSSANDAPGLIGPLGYDVDN